jgi:GDP-4-dehydro-6-deoxy-D-mannose reductase
MRILVTGAAGFAGGHLLDVLSSTNGAIVAWHRPGGAAPRPVAGVEWDAVDLLDRASVATAIARARPEAVYHCAGAAHVGRAWGDTESTFAVNVRATHYLIEALAGPLREGDGESPRPIRVLVPSSAMIYAPADVPITEDQPLLPSNPYGVSKLAQELLAGRARIDGIDARIARAFNHVGPRQDPSFAASAFARQIAEIEAGRRAPEIMVGNLEARREVTDVRDTVRAYRAILERGRPGRAYNVCSGRGIAIADLLDGLVARARVAVRVRVDPARFRPNDLPVLVGDPSRIRDELGWTPQIPLEQTLDDLLDYWRARCV